MKMLKIEVGANHDASGGGQEPYCWDLIIWTDNWWKWERWHECALIWHIPLLFEASVMLGHVFAT